MVATVVMGAMAEDIIKMLQPSDTNHPLLLLGSIFNCFICFISLITASKKSIKNVLQCK
jgi:prolipoprotein diacylglyceryltransferase